MSSGGEAVTIPKETLERARQVGYDAGFSAGLSEGRAEVQLAVERLASLLGELAAARDEFLFSAEEFVVDLSVKIARKILDGALEVDRSLLSKVVSSALRRVSADEPVSVRVHPEDSATLSAEKIEAALGAVGAMDKVRIVPDSAVEEGGCILDTSWGSIDAQLSTQLELVRKALGNSEGADELDMAA